MITYNWRDVVKEVRGRKEAIQKYYTGGEQAEQRGMLTELVNEKYKIFIQGGLTELYQAADEVFSAYNKEKRAKAAEAVSWSSARLLPEVQLASDKVERILKSPGGAYGQGTRAQGLGSVISEALTSDDRYRIKAALDVVGAAAANLPLTERELGLTDLITKAREVIAKERSTKEIMQSQLEALKAEENFNNLYDELRRDNVELGQGDPINPLLGGEMGRHFRRFRTDKSGKLVMLPADHEEVTGIVWREKKQSIVLQ